MHRNQTRNPACPLTTSKRKRAVADKATAAIQHNFPPGVAQPALRALAAAGYTSLNHLTKVRESDLLKLHGMGPKAISEIRTALKARGQSFLD
jgi:hypothetical protein